MRPRRKPEGAITTKGKELDITLKPGESTPTPETLKRISEVAKHISSGWTKTETQEWIMKTYKVNDTSANRYWNAALRYLAYDSQDSDFVEEMRQKTLATLDKLIQKEISEGRYKEANTSMDLLAKLMGYNVAKTETKITGDIKFNFGTIPGEENEGEE